MISFGIKDVIDIFSVAIILYYIYRLMKESSSANIFGGIIVFIVVWIFVSQIFEMRLLGSILDKLVMWVRWHSSFFFKKKYATSSAP